MIAKYYFYMCKTGVLRMHKTRMIYLVSGLLFAAMGLTACAPEVGTEAWCQHMDAKPKGDWTANEAGDYAKHCIFK